MIILTYNLSEKESVQVIHEGDAFLVVHDDPKGNKAIYECETLTQAETTADIVYTHLKGTQKPLNSPPEILTDANIHIS